MNPHDRDPDSWVGMEVWAGGVRVGVVAREESGYLVVEVRADRARLMADRDEPATWVEVVDVASR